MKTTQPPHVTKLLTNIKKALGMTTKVQTMIEDGRYCIDIAQQINAVIGILRKSNELLLENHLKTCAAHKLTSKNIKEKEVFINELMNVLDISTRK